MNAAMPPPNTDHILQGLNERQREAVTATEGPVLVIAGPGSGKTRALTHRIAYLIATGHAPREILAVTFTNKAAEEMRERVGRLLGAPGTWPHTNHIPHTTSNVPYIGTFHSFAAFVLRQESGAIGYRPSFSIYDEDDAAALLKEVMKELDISAKAYPTSLIAAIIGGLKNDLVAWDEYEGRDASEPFARTVAKIYEAYQRRLELANAVDFDDLIFHTVRIFRKHPAILARWQDRFRYLHIDEYQDTNTSQYELVRLLAAKHKNVFAIGDDAQCLPPETLVATPEGQRPIGTMKAGDQVWSAAGFGKVIAARVLRIHRREAEEQLVSITTATGTTLALTSGHMVFAKLTVDPNLYYVYLMERSDKGFRIGHTRGVRGGTRNGTRVLVNGLQIRANQEAADKMWILKAVHTKEDAVLHEQLFAFKYGIPTTVFYDKGRSIALSQKSINLLFSKIDSRARAEQIFRDLRLSPEHPHHRPKGVTRAVPHAPIRHRTIIDVCYFGGSQPSERYPWHDHRISLVSAAPALKAKLQNGPWSVRSAKIDSASWRIETARKNYRECREFVRTLAVAGDLEIHEKARLARAGGNFDVMPASHLRPGMIIPILVGNEIREERIASVEEQPRRGALYDLSIEHTHNYAASGVIVHNSIYSWRRADYRNILAFEKDWPHARVVLLEENYRSTPEILEAANTLIEKNADQKRKTLWTKNPSGEAPRIVAREHERGEAEFIAEEIRGLNRGGRAWRDMAVLYRTNAQSRALEEALIERDIPYAIVGGIKFFARREIKDIVAYLRYLANPDDAMALKRIINVPARGIGPRSFLAYLEKKTDSLAERERARIAAFERAIQRLRDAMRDETLAGFLRFLIKEIRYEEYLADVARDSESRIENVRELVSVARKFDALPITEAAVRLGEEVALASEQDDLRESEDRVFLMTIHAAKGLEFGIVFLAGLEEGILPHAKSVNAGRAELEEERRLAYVGMTRAKNQLYLTWALQRTIFGEHQVNMPSRFLRELPPELLADADALDPDDISLIDDDEP